MRVRTLEIRWHDSKPISTCDFQPVPYKKARPSQEKDFVGQSYRLATGGEDNNVRLWLLHPNILPPSVAAESATASSAPPVPRPPRVEYLASLIKHTAPVNVVRFSPNGEYIASAGDDGMIIIWAPTSTPQSVAFGSDADELQYEKEYWKPRTTFRCTTMQVYDIAWSPTGENIIAGSTDNVARIFAASDGKCVHEIAEHNHYIQGVAWDPLDEYIATQSSDRSMHVYSVSSKQGVLDVHAVGRNSRMPIRHSRTPSVGARPTNRMVRRQSTASDAESAVTSASELIDATSFYQGNISSSSIPQQPVAPPTPAASIASTPAAVFLPPPNEYPLSRRSSFSSNATNSPSIHGRYGRSPSPMPALPAIRAAPPITAFSSARLYGDESFTNFFRRLTFSPDGSMLLTPAGQFEDPTVIPGATATSSRSASVESGSRGRRGYVGGESEESVMSSVYIYTRANFARPPVAQLPGHKKATVAVKFSPLLYDLRPGVVGADVPETKYVAVEKGVTETVNVNLMGPFPPKTPSEVMTPSTQFSSQTLPSPALSAVDSLRAPTPTPPAVPSTPITNTASTTLPPTTGSIFSLPYRLLFAVATNDTITIHDTQQSSPICILTKLHYDEFTDMSWSPDGQCLILTSRDGYCTIVIFDEILAAYQMQQQGIQLKSIAQMHSLPSPSPGIHRERGREMYYQQQHGAVASSSSSNIVTPSSATITLPALSLPIPIPSASGSGSTSSSSTSLKRSAEPPVPLTPTASISGADEQVSTPGPSTEQDPNSSKNEEPPKKKRRVALTHIGDLGS